MPTLPRVGRVSRCAGCGVAVTLHGLYRCNSCRNMRWILLPSLEVCKTIIVPACCGYPMKFAYQWLQEETVSYATPRKPDAKT